MSIVIIILATLAILASFGWEFWGRKKCANKSWSSKVTKAAMALRFFSILALLVALVFYFSSSYAWRIIAIISAILAAGWYGRKYFRITFWSYRGVLKVAAIVVVISLIAWGLLSGYRAYHSWWNSTVVSAPAVQQVTPTAPSSPAATVTPAPVTVVSHTLSFEELAEAEANYNDCRYKIANTPPGADSDSYRVRKACGR